MGMAKTPANAPVNLVANGNFESTASWQENNWTIGGGVARLDVVAGNFIGNPLDGALHLAGDYNLVFTTANGISGDQVMVVVALNGVFVNMLGLYSGNGLRDVTVTATGTFNQLSFVGQAGNENLTLDNVALYAL